MCHLEKYAFPVVILVVMLSRNNNKSSAYRDILWYVLFTVIGFISWEFLIFWARGSRDIANNSADAGQPCLTLRPMGKGVEHWLDVITMAVGLWYSTLSIFGWVT